MITYEVISIVEQSLDTILDAHISPESTAYPTSGSTFVRVSGENTDITFMQDSIKVIVYFTVTCSVRTRDYLVQNKYLPYKILLDLQEKSFFHIIQDVTLISSLYAIAERMSVTGRFTSTNMNTRIQEVFPDFFSSTDTTSTREAGFMISQTYSTPVITIPFECLSLPAIPPPPPPE